MEQYIRKLRRKTFAYWHKKRHKRKEINVWITRHKILTALMLFLILIICFFSELIGYYRCSANKLFGDNNIGNKGELLKLIGLFIGGAAAIWTLIINNRSLKIQTRQIQIFEKNQINTRFKDAAQLLASDATSTILSGVYALHQIAEEVAKQKDEEYKGYIKIIHDILCAYVRENWRKPKEEKAENEKPIENEEPKEEKAEKAENEEPREYKPTIILQTIMDALFQNEENIYSEYRSDLTNCILKDLTFHGATFHDVLFNDGILGNVLFNGGILKNVKFNGAFLDTVRFCQSELNVVYFSGGILNRCNLFGKAPEHLFFNSTTLYNVNIILDTLKNLYFEDAKLKNFLVSGKYVNNVNFSNTILKDYSIEEITSPDRSLELTSPEAVALREEEKRKKEEVKIEQLLKILKKSNYDV